MSTNWISNFDTDIRTNRPHKLTISDKVGLIFIAILVVAIANVAVVRNMVNDINGVAETINVAGKLRMLSQKVAFETIRALNDHGSGKEKVATTLDDFGTALAALAYGGSAFGFDLKQVSDHHARQIGIIQKDWATYQTQVKSLLTRVAEQGSVSATGIGLLTQASSRVLEDAEVLVRALTLEAHDAQQYALMRVYALLVLDAIVLALVFLALRRQIVYPLRELFQSSQALANGNYHTRISYRSGDEIGQLAQEFNVAAHRIGNLISTISQERQNIKQAESMFRGLAENTVVGVYIAQDGMFRFANPKMAEMFRYEQSEMTSSIGILDINPDLLKQNSQKCMDDDIHEAKCEFRARRKDGSTFDVELFRSEMELDGKISTIGVILDITERQQVGRALRVLIACSQALVRASEESALLADICRIVQQMSGYPFVWVGYADKSGSKIIVPVALAETAGGGLLPVIGNVTWDESETGKGATGTAIRTGHTVVAQDMQTNPIYATWHAFLSSRSIVAAISLPLKAGTNIFGALTVYSQSGDTFIPDEVRILEEMADNLAYGISALRAETERRQYARLLEHNAHHDALTGLANRTRLSDRLSLALSSADRSGLNVALMLLDLDHFKVINDSMGHAAGDMLLQAVAERLSSSVRKVDTVARLGGDEFVIVMPEVASPDNAAVIARKIIDQLSRPFLVAGKEVHIGVSIGISVYPHDAKDEKVLLKNVDTAMYRAKRSGRANFRFYTEEMSM
jgi:diguanylate cyclase (GGDEF)-like protein/PAS domain S-box-containing protein